MNKVGYIYAIDATEVVLLKRNKVEIRLLFVKTDVPLKFVT
jgi:hypothetical protein